MERPIDIIYKNAVKPSIDQLFFDVEGMVIGVNYMKQTVDVWWSDRNGQSGEAKGVPLPKDGDGVYKQSVKIGDKVQLGFLNANNQNPFVTMIYTADSNSKNYKSKSGSVIAKGIAYYFGRLF